MDEADAMKITGHTTTHLFRHYDIGDVEALRERLARAREQKRSRSDLGDPDPGAVVIFLHSGDPCRIPSAPLNPRLSAPEPLAQLVEQQPFKVGIVGKGLRRTAFENIGSRSRR